MKKMLLFSLGITSVMLFSFAVVDNGVKRTAENQYEIAATSKISKADNEEIKNIIAAAYHINVKDAKSVSLKPLPDNSGKGITGKNCNWIVDETCFLQAVNKKAIKYNATVIIGSTSARLNEIFTKYVVTPTTGHGTVIENKQVETSKKVETKK